MPSWNYILGETVEEQVGSNTCQKKYLKQVRGLEVIREVGVILDNRVQRGLL